MYTEHGDLGDVAQACRQTQVGLSPHQAHSAACVFLAGSPMPQPVLSQSSFAPLQLIESQAVQAMECPALGHMLPSALLHFLCNESAVLLCCRPRCTAQPH